MERLCRSKERFFGNIGVWDLFGSIGNIGIWDVFLDIRIQLANHTYTIKNPHYIRYHSEKKENERQ